MIPTCVRIIALPTGGHGELGAIQVQDSYVDSYLCERYRSLNWRPFVNEAEFRYMIPTCVKGIALSTGGHGQLGGIQVHDFYLCERYHSPNWRPWPTRQNSGTWFLLVWEVSLFLTEAMADKTKLKNIFCYLCEGAILPTGGHAN